MTASSVPPATSPQPPRRLTAWNLLFLVLWLYLLVRLAPHLAAVVGIETGGGGTPVFTYPALDGGVISSEALKGKVVLVNFWATWCPPCRVEMPLLQRMADRHRAEGLVVVGLSMDLDPPEKVAAFLAERDIRYPVAIVGRSTEQLFGGVRGYPTSFLLDRTGRIRQKALGPLAMASFEPAVRRLLSEK